MIGANWDGLLAVIASARADHVLNQERARNPLDCPRHGWPLEQTSRGLHCPFGGHVIKTY